MVSKLGRLRDGGAEHDLLSQPHNFKSSDKGGNTHTTSF